LPCGPGCTRAPDQKRPLTALRPSSLRLLVSPWLDPYLRPWLVIAIERSVVPRGPSRAEAYTGKLTHSRCTTALKTRLAWSFSPLAIAVPHSGQGGLPCASQSRRSCRKSTASERCFGSVLIATTSLMDSDACGTGKSPGRGEMDVILLRQETSRHATLRCRACLRTNASGGNPAAFHPLSPLAVPLLLEPRCTPLGAADSKCTG
jgi:hypothetical protein